MPERHRAKRWVEAHHPAATGQEKANLILAFGAGLDAGLAEAEETLRATALALLETTREPKGD
jgi:hypothetical protein